MFVYEFFKTLNYEKIIETMCSFPGFFEMIDWDNTIDENEKNKRKNIIKAKYLKALKDMEDIDYKKNEKEVIIVTTRIESEIYYDASSLPLRKVYLGETLEEFKNPMFDIIFTNRNETLGKLISKTSIEEYGEYNVAAAILKQITFFGIDNDFSTKRQKEEILNLENIVKDLEENPNQKMYTEEELWEELGIEREKRTPEEEKEYQDKIYKELEKNIKELKRIIYKTLKEFGF